MENGKRLAFVIPYFGKLPDYFSEWAYTLSFLEGRADFLLMTDDAKNPLLDNAPSNLKVFEMSFDEFRAKVQSKFDFKIALSYPYKICDYRPAYGYIFEDLLKDYDFWGNCDLDQIWGDVGSVITDEILENYEKILHLGHFTLYKNCEKMNSMFRNNGAYADYREVFTCETLFAFDEIAGIVPICRNNGVKVYFETVYADIDKKYTRVKLRSLPNYKKQIVYWKDGKVFRSYIEGGEVRTESFIYAHFQKKHPRSIDACGMKPSAFIVNAKEFIDISGETVDVKLIEKYSDYIDDRTDENDKKRFIRSKIIEFLKSSPKDKLLWLRKKLKSQKIYR
ncbi:MAG: hypothetical protein IJU39_06510 [Clostridia bacterium]|nr:hypothetical protein [Clostridia bacterium]